MDLRHKTVLELGCGATGRDADEFLRRGAHYIGIDISTRAVKALESRVRTAYPHYRVSQATAIRPAHLVARKHPQAFLISGDLVRELERCRTIAAGGIFVVHAHSSLHYFPPVLLRRILRNIAAVSRYLSVGFKTPSDRTFVLGEKLLHFAHAAVYENEIHRQVRFFYSRREVERLLTTAGFETLLVEECSERFDARQRGRNQFSPFINAVARSLTFSRSCV